MTDPIQSSRYLVPGVALCFLLLLTTNFDYTKKTSILALILSCVYATYLTSGYFTYFKSGLSSQELGQSGQIDSQRKDLIALLEQNKLFYGYSTYWNAAFTSVLSNEKIKIRAIQVENGLPLPMRYLSSNAWYRSSAWLGKTFLLLKKEEAEHLDWDELNTYGVFPIEILKYKDFVIYIFEENLAKKIPKWDSRIESPLVLPVSGKSNYQVGKLESIGNSSTYILTSKKNEKGALHFGPYINLDAGSYIANYDIYTSGQNLESVKLDVYSHSPKQKIFGQIYLKNNDDPKFIKFTLDEMRNIEFRVWVLGNAEVLFKGVTITKVEDK